MDQRVIERLNSRLGFDGDFRFGDWAAQMESAVSFESKVYVDGTFGDPANDGLSKSSAKKTIQQGVNICPPGGTVLIYPKFIPVGVTDPTDYAENVVIPMAKSNIRLQGVGSRTQGGLPQIKKGSGALPQITVQAPGVTIAGLGINGAGNTGGGILIDSDGGVTKDAFGLSILGCHFKNCKVSASDGSLGGAIYWAANGGSWAVQIAGNKFYKNVADIVLLGTALSLPQDVVIEDNEFSDAVSCDVNLFLKGGGSGIAHLFLNRNIFPALPALSAGGIKRFMDLTGCVGIMSGNMFGCKATITFRAASMGTGALVPATVFMADNWAEDGTTPLVHTA